MYLHTQKWHIHRAGRPGPHAFYTYVGCVLAQVIFLIFCKHEPRSKLFSYQLFLEADCWIQCIMGCYLAYQKLVS